MLLLIWADEKYNTQKNPCVVFATQKNPGLFHRPKKIPFGQNVRPKKILLTPTPPALTYVSGASRGSYLGQEKRETFIIVPFLPAQLTAPGSLRMIIIVTHTGINYIAGLCM